MATPLGAGRFRCTTTGSTTVIARFMSVDARRASLQCATAPTQVGELRLSRR